ncbi:MAG: hypothetical protein MJ233_03400 [Mycoplasmoidaceae bacterium]|nr:hypothetical protein [Mycoplasmoidaceae bacterium]
MRTFDAKKKPFNFQITQNWVLGVPQSGTFYYNGGECTRTPYSIPRG